MARKLALKKLTASDLTLFKWHFQNNPAGKQKAFNLDSRVLVDELYPQLREPAAVPQPRFSIDLYLLGPGMAQSYNLQRKILKQQKNWRLNGEFIDSPEDDPQRYNILLPGDFALFEFSGDVVPGTAKIVLVAQALPVDAGVHRELDRRYPEGSMWLLDEEEIEAVLAVEPLPIGHPLFEWLKTDDLEDAVLGGVIGVEKINRRREGRGITPEEFVSSRQVAEQTGVLGEVLLNEYFDRQLERGNFEWYEWTSSINAVSPYDFRIGPVNGDERLVDAKSTRGGFSNPIHLSLSELRRAVEGRTPYDIYRLYNVVDDCAKMRIAHDVGPVLRSLLDVFETLPAEVSVDAVSVRPEFLDFDEMEFIVSLGDVN
ncbi:DUF3883 domain-containing protein [Lysobacter sp. Root604]|uniref:protein NO VEIN domain-containing protein n=1 Tax=Lysobacter sp. Root604 TaxID=1736568 RepID=UPI0009E9B1FC|nr:DUF3883 domain-containing protein [Lysobacter sp. Root604]